ncbi:MAG: alpha/beta fold hydrolase [Gordonia sp. (in: high G+C Gram-positive bacteria)]|uniref:alpha/beta fold hydrolase n=1 Tax=Gordonia TaxID=2053 RepID=UPI003264B835
MLFSGRLAATAGGLLTAAALLAGCAVGPDTGPDIVRGDRGAAPADIVTQPALQAPERDLNWRPCASALAAQYRTSAPDGVTLECARYDVPVSSTDRSGATIRVGAVRARSAATPADAAPIVLTSGDDLPSSRTLLTFADGAGRSLLDRHPLVAVDHRGMGTSGLIDCMTTAQRATYDVNAAGPGRSIGDRAEKLSESARTAADQCNDTLHPDQLDYSAADAGEDLEQLRQRWNVDRLALLAVGSGSSVALAYAAAHPDAVGRLILDTPVGYNVTADEAAAARARGLQASLTAFVQRCAGAGCSIGANGGAVLGRLMSGGATAGDDALADTEVLQALTTALAVGDTSPAGLKELGNALSAADRGDTAALRALADRSRPLRLADGQIVARCNDMRGRPGTDRVASLAADWAARAPLTAATSALDLVRCDGWGVTDTPPAPDRFAVNPLILVGQNDPINGAEAAQNLIPLMLAANTAQTTVTWDGLGYSVAAHSRCATDLIGQYLGEAPLTAPAERTCPA